MRDIPVIRKARGVRGSLPELGSEAARSRMLEELHGGDARGLHPPHAGRDLEHTCSHSGGLAAGWAIHYPLRLQRV